MQPRGRGPFPGERNERVTPIHPPVSPKVSACRQHLTRRSPDPSLPPICLLTRFRRWSSSPGSRSSLFLWVVVIRIQPSSTRLRRIYPTSSGSLGFDWRKLSRPLLGPASSATLLFRTETQPASYSADRDPIPFCLFSPLPRLYPARLRLRTNLWAPSAGREESKRVYPRRTYPPGFTPAATAFSLCFMTRIIRDFAVVFSIQI